MYTNAPPIVGQMYYVRNLRGRELKFPKFHCDWMNGVLMRKGLIQQIYIFLYTYDMYFGNNSEVITTFIDTEEDLISMNRWQLETDCLVTKPETLVQSNIYGMKTG